MSLAARFLYQFLNIVHRTNVQYNKYVNPTYNMEHQC